MHKYESMDSDLMHKTYLVEKRNGSSEAFNIDKIHRVMDFAVEGLKGVSAADIEINARLNLRDGITTRQIHEVLIEAARDLITENAPNYQYVAGRLLNYQLRKDVWGGKNPPKLYDVIVRNIEAGVYDKLLLEQYSVDEINKLDEYINHDKDLKSAYAGIKQLMDKYLIKNRHTGQIYETPQFAYMAASMFAFSKYDKATRLDYVKKFYQDASDHKPNLPTPIIAGVRSTMRSFASCCLIGVGDTMQSLAASNAAAAVATSKRYGIGIDMGSIRAINAPIRHGDVLHTGVIPFLKWFESAVKACHQNGIRGGGATVNFPIFHYEIVDILQLKNNAGTDDNRVRKLDYTIGFSALFNRRWLAKEDITLFSSHEVPELFAAHGTSDFERMYVEAEKNPNIKFKKTIPARELYALFTKEKYETGRIYTLNVDHANTHGAFLDTCHMSNLCTEVIHPTIPMNSLDDPEAEVGVCILGAINMLECNTDSALERTCNLLVRFLDEIIDLQDYFNEAARRFATKRRSLAIGVTNYAAWLAKHNAMFTMQEAIELTDIFFEKMQYFLLKASCKLAEEKGACEFFHKTKYSQGILPIDTYKEEVNEIISRPLAMDWEGLRADIAKHGLRHSTVSAQMPCESSSVVMSSTNGVEPPRSLITYKKSPSGGSVPVLVPNVAQWKNKYSMAWTFDNSHIIKLHAVMQKYIDMAISTNLYYDRSQYPKGRLPDTVQMKDHLDAHRYGLKSIYYINSKPVADATSRASLEAESAGCDSGACAI